MALGNKFCFSWHLVSANNIFLDFGFIDIERKSRFDAILYSPIFSRLMAL